MARSRSPIVVGQCFDWPFKPRAADDPRRVCRWVCARLPDAAEFVSRSDPRRTAVLHPSTKQRAWQVSFFDERGAISDVLNRDCNAALYNAGIIPAAWKLRTALPLGGARR